MNCKSCYNSIQKIQKEYKKSASDEDFYEVKTVLLIMIMLVTFKDSRSDLKQLN